MSLRKRRIKLYISIVVLILSIISLTHAAYAWFITDSSVNEMGFQVLQIDSQVTVFIGEDFNYNGILDQLNSDKVNKYIDVSTGEKTYVDYKRRYYEEKNLFKYFDSKYALTADTSANTLNDFTIEDLAPSKIYTIKFEITNYAGFENYASLLFQNEEVTGERLELLSAIQTRAGYVDEFGKVNYYSSWTDFVDGEGNYQGLEVANNIKISKAGSKAEDGRIDLWLQFRIKNDFEFSSTENIDSINLALPRFFLNLTAQED